MSRSDRQLDEEIRAHLEMAEEDYRRQGMDPSAARAAARRNFGPVEPMKEEHRQSRPLYWLDTIRQDLRYGLRSLKRNPAFTAAAVVTLALGIGASVAVFSVVYAVLLRAAPYPEPDRLVWVTSTVRAFPDQPEIMLRADFVEWRDEVQSFSQLAIYQNTQNNFIGPGGAQNLPNARVSAQFLSVLRVRPILGRDFRREDEEPGRGRVVILSHAFWRQEFGSDESAIGSRILLADESFTIVGVLPQDFVFPLSTASEIRFSTLR